MSDITDTLSAMGAYQAASASDKTALDNIMFARGGRQRQGSVTPGLLSANIFYMGDSRVASFYNDTTAKNNKNAGNHLVVANTQMGQRMVTIGNTAVAGQRSNEYNSSTSTMTASTAGTLIGLGVVNDIAQGRTGADAWTTVKAIIDAAIAAGKSVVWHTEPGAEGFTATQIGYRNDFNTLLRAYAAANPQTLRVFDFAAAVLTDPASTTAIAFKSGYSYDGTHLTNAGSRQAGQAFAAWAVTQIGGTQIDLTTGTNLLANPGFTTATGGSTVTGITGSVPASWGVVRAGGTPTATVGTSVAPDGTGNQFDMAITAGANSDRVIFQQLITPGSAIVVNDKVRWAVRIAMDAGVVNLRSVRGYMTAQFDLSGTSSNIQKFDMQPIATHLNTDGSAYIDLLSPEIMTISKSGTTTFDRLDCSIAAEFSGAGSATFHVRQPQLVKIP